MEQPVKGGHGTGSEWEVTLDMCALAALGSAGQTELDHMCKGI